LPEEVRHVRTTGVRTDGKSQEIPASHRDLVECPAVAALTTVTADGYPHTSVVWCDFDGGCIRVNTMRGFVMADPQETRIQQRAPFGGISLCSLNQPDRLVHHR
jgi:pyridoxamine 5'-phosphate oxidase-like protein